MENEKKSNGTLVGILNDKLYCRSNTGKGW